MRWGLLFLCIVFLACEETPFFEKAVDIPNSTWSYDNVIAFPVTVQDTSQFYDLFLNLTHSDTYSHQNLYVKITTAFPKIDDKVEQLSIDLADTKGQWEGKCSGGTCKAKVYLLENFKFADPGKYVFSFEQFTREKELEGIDRVALEIVGK